MPDGAVFDPTETFRYALWREWDPARPRVAFVMLNPSTAGADRDDPTVRRCVAFARAWGFGALDVVNLFAFRSPSPRDLRAAADLVGPDNDRHLARVVRRAQIIIVAWGNGGALAGRGDAVLGALSGFSRPLRCLGVTQSGQPRHPLYVPGRATPVLWNAA